MAEEDQDVKEDEMNGEDDMSEVVILKSYLLTLERHNVFEFLSFLLQFRPCLYNYGRLQYNNFKWRDLRAFNQSQQNYKQ